MQPLIEELNFPLARDCSGGDTSILVNGRELHEEDLLVLSNRGLPTTQGKSYTLDINGHVVDTTTSEQVLQCRLGRLAPSYVYILHAIYIYRIYYVHYVKFLHSFQF